MRLSENNFSSSTVIKHDSFGTVRKYKRYTYETHNALFDVDVDNDGTLYFKKNSSPIPVERNAIHNAIIKHYEL